MRRIIIISFILCLFTVAVCVYYGMHVDKYDANPATPPTSETSGDVMLTITPSKK